MLIVPAIGFGLATASYVALAAVGFTLQAGVSNIFNFAYGDIMITAAFVAYAVNAAGGTLWQLLIVGAVTGAIVSVAMNRLIFRRFVRHGVNQFGMLIVTLWSGLLLQRYSWRRVPVPDRPAAATPAGLAPPGRPGRSRLDQGRTSVAGGTSAELDGRHRRVLAAEDLPDPSARCWL